MSLQSSPELLEKGLEAVKQRDYSLACRHLGQVVEQCPDNVDAIAGYARALRELGSMQQASAVIYQARAHGVDDARVWAEQGWLNYFRYETDEAGEAFREALGRDGDNVSAVVGSSAVLRRQGSANEARDLLGRTRERVLTASGVRALDVEEGFLALDACDYATAEGCFLKALEGDSLDEYPLAGLLTVLRALHRLDEADKRLREMTGFRQRPELLSEAGWIAYDRGVYGEAVKYFEDALALDPDYEYAIVGKSQGLRAQGRLNEAERFLGEKLVMENASCRHELIVEAGWLAYDRGDYALAAMRFKHALSLPGCGSSVSALVGKSETLRVLCRFDEAMELLEGACDCNPFSGQLKAQLGIVQQAAGRPEDALRSLSEALGSQGWKPGLWMALGRVHHELGDSNTARQEFEKALELYGATANCSSTPTPFAVVGQCEALRALGRAREAVILARQAIGTGSGNTRSGELWCQLGAALEDDGSYEEALGSLSSAQRGRPCDPVRAGEPRSRLPEVRRRATRPARV